MEDRVPIVGSRFRGPTMTLGNLANIVQAKTETGVPFVAGATFERLKDRFWQLLVDHLQDVIPTLPTSRDRSESVGAVHESTREDTTLGGSVCSWPSSDARRICA